MNASLVSHILLNSTNHFHIVKALKNRIELAHPLRPARPGECSLDLSYTCRKKLQYTMIVFPSTFPSSLFLQYCTNTTIGLWWHFSNNCKQWTFHCKILLCFSNASYSSTHPSCSSYSSTHHINTPLPFTMTFCSETKLQSTVYKNAIYCCEICRKCKQDTKM